MTALVLDRPAPPEELAQAMHLTEQDVPEPGPGQVRVRVGACGLNPVDWKVARSGSASWDWPHVLGLDVAGTVDALGDGVCPDAHGPEGSDPLRADLAVGARVALHHDLRRPGGLAEYVVVDAQALAHVPAPVSLTAAAALPCAGMTALQALTRLHVGEQQTLLVTGGAGGVGGYAVQLARLMGARVIATASPGKAEAVRALGADEVLDYRALGSPEAVAAAARALTPQGRGVDAVLDTLGAGSATANLAALAFNGGLAYIGGRPDLAQLPGFSVSPSLHEVSLGAAYSAGTSRDRLVLTLMLTSLLTMVADGELDPRVERAVALQEAPQAYLLLAQGHALGKTVAVVDASL
ncbi:MULTISPECIES: zinc-binding dehydrogenase [unclassified Actinomyces]|nr:MULTISPECIES: zinc-binding dehydrogenase [unclassified Actinomyces]MCL3776568.1 zinc-binding dehydrogenase [Actinomyces sp. AC-20-1]MCL3788854.1 zinc-binding dehydrogenase [Actinomyces sp. 187325]